MEPIFYIFILYEKKTNYINVSRDSSVMPNRKQQQQLQQQLGCGK
jgi:hypothetical protein